jgi:superfamily I DNA/RNA helicase
VDLSGLNPNQKRVVDHDQGPLLVLAGAGSGKTNTMAYRIAHLLAVKGVQAHQILGLSFTNKAAAELKHRVQKVLNGRVCTKRLFIGTFHSLCVRILRQYAHLLGYSGDFSILDSSDQEEVVKRICKNLSLDEKTLPAKIQLMYFSLAKNKFLDDEQAGAYFECIKGLTPGGELHLQQCFAAYKRSLLALNAMDYDDLIFNTARLLKEQLEVRQKLKARFLHLIIDEYQDTNAAQFEIVTLLNTDNLVVVGDDDQAIYAWRGASSEHILNFSKQFENVQVVTLDQNYRSTNVILQASNAVIAKNRQRHPKTLWSNKPGDEKIHHVAVEDDQAEAVYVANQIQEIQKVFQWSWNAFAVLYRSNTQSRVFEQVFRNQGIPYRIIGGMSFLERKEVKDTISYLRVFANRKDDVALRRILNWPARGIGLSTLETLSSAATAHKMGLMEVLHEVSSLGGKKLAAVGGAQQASLVEFWIKVSQTRQALTQATTPEALKAWFEQFLVSFDLKRGLEEDTKNPGVLERKWENIQAVLTGLMMQVNRTPSPFAPLVQLSHFCAKMALQTQDEGNPENTSPQVTLLTLHGAKGLEYEVVFLVGLEDGLLPHRRSIEDISQDLSEERRLFYVGITRAKLKLFLVYCKNRNRYGKKVPRHISRFMKDIPLELLDMQDQTLPLEQEGAKQQLLQEIEKRLFGGLV